MKTLYFDIDGTVLVEDADAVKDRLGNGALENAIQAAGFTQLVCVGNFAAIANTVREIHPDYDGIGVLFRLCRGAFEDEAWLRSKATLVLDPGNRAAHIDPSGDWWYVDDLAEYYMRIAGKANLFREHVGGRICVANPSGDGSDVLEWLGSAAL